MSHTKFSTASVQGVKQIPGPHIGLSAFSLEQGAFMSCHFMRRGGSTDLLGIHDETAGGETEESEMDFHDRAGAGIYCISRIDEA